MAISNGSIEGEYLLTALLESFLLPLIISPVCVQSVKRVMMMNSRNEKMTISSRPSSVMHIVMR